MDAIYQFRESPNKKFRSIGLIKKDSKIFSFEKTHNGVNSREEARNQSVKYIVSNFVDVCDTRELDIYTNTCEMASDIKKLSLCTDKNITFYDNYSLNKYTHKKSFVDINNMWKISNFICFNPKVQYKLNKKPEPPYEVYTDASFWWRNKNNVSIGFLIVGSEGGLYTTGYPVEDENITDNNLAECHAVLSALQSIPENTDITIYTDSSYVYTNINSKDSYNNEILEKINNKIEKFDNSIIEQVSRSVTEIADLTADICKNKEIKIGKIPA